MKHKYILMCALAMMSFATQAQDDVLYDISTTPATEVVVGHIYVLQNRAYPDYGLIYDSNQGFATTFEPVSEQLGQSVTSDQPFLFTATADGITLPVTLININDNGEMGYGNAGGGQVLSPRRNAAASDETTYFTVKDQDGQLAMLTYNVEDEYCDLYGVIYGGENTTPAECAQWIAYEVTEHEHQWEYSDSNVHFCTCGKYAVHELDDCSCTVCKSKVHEFDYENYPLTCTRCGESCQHPRIDYKEAKEPTCYSDGWKEHYECPVCGDVFKDEAGNEPYDDYYLCATGHDFDDDLLCTRCNAQLNVKGNLINGESVAITMTKTDYEQCSNPAASPLYSFETETSNMLFNVSVSADVTDGRVSVFDKNFRYVNARDFQDSYIGLKEASTYYAMFYYHGGEEENSKMEGVATLSLEDGSCSHVWETVYNEEGHSYYHHCTKDGCDAEERHYVTGEDGVCVCGYKCSKHSYHMDDYASVKATENADGQYIVVKRCEYCNHEKTETVNPDGECPKGGNHSWADDGTINATCTAKGYTYHICKKCEMLYVADFTPVDLNNHEWAIEQQWNEADEFVSMHFCCNGCEAHGNLEEHTMDEEGKCVCGYWPGHTEHQWEADSNGHFCTIPGCEEHGVREDHEMGGCVCTICGYTEHYWYDGVCEICRTVCQHEWDYGYCYICGTSCEHVTEEGSCLCTVCGYTEHYWYDGVCENCRTVCDHENPWYEEARDATCIKNGNKAYYVCVCDLYFADADCTEKITWENIRIPATGHQFDEEHHCTVCDRSITIGCTITLGEQAKVNFNNYCGRYNENDPTAEPLYKIELTKAAAYNFSISEELDSPSIAIFDKDFNYILTVDVNEPKSLEAGTCYLLPSAYLEEEDEDEGGFVEFAGIDVPLTITRIESITLETAEATDEHGDAVVITLTDDGSYATEQNIVLKDGVESFDCRIDFTAPQVDYERYMTKSQWGTLCLPFDITVDAANKPYDFYELTSATSTEVTLTKVADGKLAAGTPVLVRRNASETGVHFTENDVIVRASVNCDNVGEEKDGLQMVGVFEPWLIGYGRYYLDSNDGMLYDAGEYFKQYGNSVVIGVYRCYFQVVGMDGEARALNINFEEEVSSIEAIDALTSGKAEFYDLQGRERSELQSGLNVLRYGNGKSVKVIIK